MKSINRRACTLCLLALLFQLAGLAQQDSMTAVQETGPRTLSGKPKAFPREDSIGHLGSFGQYLALDFTQPERDSMVEAIRDFRLVYERIHAFRLTNQAAFPFAYHAAPAHVKRPVSSAKNSWNIPLSVPLPANRNELAWYSIEQLASLIKTRKISSVELTRFFLDRLHRYNDTLHCVISFTDAIALQQARQADEELRKGIYRGPLHGIPYGLKDLFAVKGTRTTWGSAPYQNQVIDEDAFVYKQLRKAGAVLCAKLSLGALAYDDLWFGGLTRNPWNMNTGSSGSSAGSASATAAGLLPFAIGTETWGSIISPSHTCGLTGLRPTFGSVSRSGAMVLGWSLDKVGPICRSAQDAALVFSAIKGADEQDVSSIERAFNYPSDKDLKSLKVAYAANLFDRLPKDAPEWNVIDTYRQAGLNVIPVNFPDSLYDTDIMSIIINAESAAAFEELTLSNRDSLIERQDKAFWPNTFRSARFIPAVEYINANRLRTFLTSSFTRFLEQFDLVIVPTFVGNESVITNLTGHPVICFPIGLKKNGLPTSISLVGNYYQEAIIIAAAKIFQDRTSFDELHPEYFKK